MRGTKDGVFDQQNYHVFFVKNGNRSGKRKLNSNKVLINVLLKIITIMSLENTGHFVSAKSIVIQNRFSKFYVINERYPYLGDQLKTRNIKNIWLTLKNFRNQAKYQCCVETSAKIYWSFS